MDNIKSLPNGEPLNWLCRIVSASKGNACPKNKQCDERYGRVVPDFENTK